MTKKMLLISNMYPNQEFPDYGTFVKVFSDGLENFNWNISKVVLNKKKGTYHKLLSYLNFILRSFFALNFRSSDVTYIHYASHSTIPLIISRKQKNLVVNVHGTDVLPNNRKQKLFDFFTRYSLNVADLVVVPSIYFKGVVEEKYKISSNKIFVSPSGGVSEKFYSQNKDREKNSSLRMGYVGRIESKKGWQTFLDAIKLSENKDIEFYIYGSGSNEDLLIQELKNLTNFKIKFLGRIGHEELPEVYRSLDWLIFPSESESLGLVGIESMVTGTPIIASKIPGIESYAIHEKNSLLFPKKDSKQLADYINLVEKMSPTEWKKFSNEAIQTSKQFHKDSVMAKLNNKIEEAVK